MNDKIKNFIHAHYISVPVCIVLCIIACIWFYADRASSTDVNERIETRINRIDELNQRTEGAITNSQEHIRAARENAINAKRIVGEGERILRNADERTQKNQDATKEQ